MRDTLNVAFEGLDPSANTVNNPDYGYAHINEYLDAAGENKRHFYATFLKSYHSDRAL